MLCLQKLLSYSIISQLKISYISFDMNLHSFLNKILFWVSTYAFMLVQFLRLNILWKKFRSLKPKYQITIAIFLLVLYIAARVLIPPSWPDDAKVVEVHIASKEDLKVTSKLIGSIEAKKYFSIEAVSPGIIDYIAPAGTALKKNERIASLDAPEIEKAYFSALKAAEIAGKQYEREKKLLNAGASSSQKVELKYIALSNARIALASAKNAMDKIVFTAPFDGIVGSPLLFHGSKANAGDKIVTFYDDSDLVVKFDIPSKIAAKLPNKTKAKIGAEEYDVYVQRALSKDSYSVPAYLEFKCDRCIIGEVADLDLYVAYRENTLILPSSCIFIMNGFPAVYKVIDGKAELAIVKTGERQEDIIEILDGIEAEDTIISDGQGRLYPGVKVEIHDGK